MTDPYLIYGIFGVIAICLTIFTIKSGLGLVTAIIAKNKGYSHFILWWIFGFFFFLISLVVALCIADKVEKNILMSKLLKYDGKESTLFQGKFSRSRTAIALVIIGVIFSTYNILYSAWLWDSEYKLSDCTLKEGAALEDFYNEYSSKGYDTKDWDDYLNIDCKLKADKKISSFYKEYYKAGYSTNIFYIYFDTNYRLKSNFTYADFYKKGFREYNYSKTLFDKYFDITLSLKDGIELKDFYEDCLTKYTYSSSLSDKYFDFTTLSFQKFFITEFFKEGFGFMFIFGIVSIIGGCVVLYKSEERLGEFIITNERIHGRPSGGEYFDENTNQKVTLNNSSAFSIPLEHIAGFNASFGKLFIADTKGNELYFYLSNSSVAVKFLEYLGIGKLL